MTLVLSLEITPQYPISLLRQETRSEEVIRTDKNCKMIYCRDYAAEVAAEAAKDELVASSSKKTITNKDNGRVASVGANEINPDVTNSTNASDVTMADNDTQGEKKKKKKRKPKKKKKQAGNGAKSLVVGVPSKKPSFHGLKEDALLDYYIKLGQTDPPTIPGTDCMSMRHTAGAIC